ncbi:Flp family type IVb pilin [Mycobacterium tuberculosis]|jgi:pilus assembly protein Flp/PilA|uniref:Flp family type IVb pilin n=1 Tax=unclassified Variovorax TaxID=663243 RepID=UPI000E28C2DF|nr:MULTISPECIES: Flp family type IVb pilin [unclassified Variovorax]REM67831.1 Flp family type IVb pilin [Mycobacterium tuberculosis]REN19533.1 Flp family type IVb pilin [Mycobacterium tuberculosis]RSZ41093.1 Flp family type IVb pilin [Variovorax sp. 553]RSZ41999.1 Flp family type IVb pilin [Variovorax sp. 679]
MRNSIIRFLRDEEGATAIEYGIIAGLISIAIVTVLSGNTGLGSKLSGIFTYITGKLVVPTT